ncbi:RimK domain protein ATP-grasp [Methanocaldococcus infernus ME]|uniref:Coenzyme gamma-F420-2:alpha-L-glutamate ligase n=1 Tax=Methanocaldococcus infernus (strain DSM 11812 / JCM 15783 / ME) TaxID=573063 RepID=D5VS78_METIM|nr:RimK domain protein ATP-grasp [Methanocaldococcus infernus ME]
MIIIVSPEAKSETVYRIKREIENFRKDCKILKLASSNFFMDDSFFLENVELIHSRCSIGFYENNLTLFSWQVLQALEVHGYKFINSLDTVYLTSDKFKTIKLLKKNNILAPKTALIRDYEDALKFMEKNNLEFPIIIKCCFSKCGETVFKVNNLKELRERTEKALWKSLIAQEYIDFKVGELYKDIRLLVIDDEIFGYSRVSKNFKTNLYCGNKVEPIKINDELKEIAFKCKEVSGAKILGIDILPYKDKYYVIELNSAPGTKGFLKLGMNVDKKIAELFVREAKS